MGGEASMSNKTARQEAERLKPSLVKELDVQLGVEIPIAGKIFLHLQIRKTLSVNEISDGRGVVPLTGVKDYLEEIAKHIRETKGDSKEQIEGQTSKRTGESEELTC
jgi:hypothetical protein